ncbi:MAG: cyclic nucleotide-binding/CBS domain-containing protein, partial [Nitrospinota bacterium]
MIDPEHLEMEEEFRQYQEEPKAPKPLDSDTFLEPLKKLRIRTPETLVAEPTEQVYEAACRMSDHGVGCILVVQDGKVIGICSERDIIQKVVCRGLDPSSVRIEEVMTSEPECLQPDDAVAFVLHLMHVGGYRHVPLVNENHEPEGIVSVKDIVEHIVDHFPEEVYNLPPRP